VDSWWELGEHSGYSGGVLETHRLTCAFCGEEGNFSLSHRETKKHASDKDKVLYFDTLRCGNCANFLMAFWSAGSALYGYHTVPWRIGEFKIPEAWPKEVSRFWQQAKRASARGDLDAAAVMARSAMQAALRASDASGKTLRHEIDNLAEKGLLPPVMKEWAHELRLLGNSSAHPDDDEPAPEKNDVTDVVLFLEQLLTYLFSLPDLIAQYRGRKNAPK